MADSDAFQSAFLELEACEQQRDAANARVVQMLESTLNQVVRPRLERAAVTLKFAFRGVQARGMTMDWPTATPIFVLLDGDTCVVVERRAHGASAVVRVIEISDFIRNFGIDSRAAILSSLASAEARAPRHADADTDAGAERRRSEPTENVTAGRTTATGAEASSQPSPPPRRRHVRELDDDKPAATPEPALSPRAGSSATHDFCRFCGARLPKGRLSAHFSVAHGVIRVPPHANADVRRSAAAASGARKNRLRTLVGAHARAHTPGPKAEHAEACPLAGSLAMANDAGRDFLRETRIERTLVVRADSPLRDRARDGRFSDAPDVERMDDENESIQ